MEKKLIQQQEDFFRTYFQTEADLKRFIQDKWDYTDDLSPRRMLNNVYRLVTLSDDMDKIRPDRRDLSVFFLVTCIESLYQYLTNHPKIQKQEMVIQFFDKHLSAEDRKIVEDSIHFSLFDDETGYHTQISIEQFALLLTSIRNNVAHEGNYWSFSFNEEGYDGNTISVLDSKLQKDEGKKTITYEVSLTYSQFRDICIRTFISFINAHYNRVHSQ
ncbi:hypothetical protein ACFYU8_18235 [Brevibacillus sp. NPDC003359]|uniref:hypothetical protein n=1 Tax=unclassified Brevibacillus TaxID=2684853 RepID=UPI00368B8B77